MKIETDEYKTLFSEILGKELTEKLLEAICEKLFCSGCGKFKNDNEFHVAKSFFNRRNRFPKCRECAHAYYQDKKVKDHVSNKR